MKKAWPWLLIAAGVFAVNLYYGLRLQSAGADGPMTLVHHGLAAIAFLFGAGVLVSHLLQDRARAKLKALGLSDEDIDRLAKDGSAEADVIQTLKKRQAARAK